MAGSVVWFTATLPSVGLLKLGVLRLLTSVQLMGADEVLTQLQAWSIYSHS